MKQLSLAETGFLPRRGKVTRKAEFFAEMSTVVPCSRHEGLIEPVYSKAGRSCPSTPLSVMLQSHFMQHCLIVAATVSNRSYYSRSSEGDPKSAVAELLALAGGQVSERSRPLSDRKVKTATDRSWPTALKT